MKTPAIHLGFEVGGGAPVEIPLAHTFVTGQTQLSGKTTTLRAIVERSGQRALAFVTKRGESFEGRRTAPYLPREGDEPIHWRLVETILASALGERKLKYERLWIINAAKGAKSLQQVQDNVHRLLSRTKSGRSVEAYTLIGEYLDLVLPDMRVLGAADTLVLEPGLNVMDLTDVGLQLQALVIRASLAHINDHEEGVLTVFPEAWEFAPRGRSAPAKDEAIRTIRKGAVLQNFLLCDSQDLAGVDTVIRQGCHVWILGVQRELNELKRTLQMIPAGIKRPKPEEVAQLELGQFFACWGSQAIKTYVRPTWMPEDLARDVATGKLDVRNAAAIASGANVRHAARKAFGFERVGAIADRVIGTAKEEAVTKTEADKLTRENEQLRRDNEQLRTNNQRLLTRIEALEKGQRGEKGTVRDGRRVGAARAAPDSEPRSHRTGDHAESVGRDDAPAAVGQVDRNVRASSSVAGATNGHVDEALYQAIKARLLADAPAILRLSLERPELEVAIERRTIPAEGASTLGRVARLIKADFFAESARFRDIIKALERTGTRINNKTLSVALQELVVAGFLTKESVDRYRVVPEMQIRVVEAKAS